MRRALPAMAAQRRLLAGGALVGLCLAGLVEIARHLVERNFHVVVSGQVYRSGQPSPARLARMVRDYGIRSVINLRGDFMPSHRYEAEIRAARELGLQLIDAGLWSNCLPQVSEACAVIDAIDTAAPPVLLHCQSGSDRTGLAAALVLLLHTDADLACARMQMSLHYGHAPIGRPAVLDRFLDMYQDWLQTRDLTHSADRLRWWVRHEYRPDAQR
jgi:protein tyrosine/serine phosphatase